MANTKKIAADWRHSTAKHGEDIK